VFFIVVGLFQHLMFGLLLDFYLLDPSFIEYSLGLFIYNFE